MQRWAKGEKEFGDVGVFSVMGTDNYGNYYRMLSARLLVGLEEKYFL